MYLGVRENGGGKHSVSQYKLILESDTRQNMNTAGKIVQEI